MRDSRLPHILHLLYLIFAPPTPPTPHSSVGFSCPLSYMKRDHFFNKRKLYLLHILDGNFG